MSEKIYAWLLRLFPSRFREEYGEDVLQLFRDRARYETGFFPALRLWMDLLIDLAISIPREYGRAEPELVSASAWCRLDGLPSFYVLHGEALRPGSLLFGSVATLTALAACWVLLGHGGNYRGLERFGVGQSPGSSGFADSPVPPPTSRTTAGATSAAPFESGPLDAAEKRRVIDGAVANLKQHYVDPYAAEKMADSLLAHEKNGDDNAARDGVTFAGLLTRQMREVNPDRHLVMVYSETPLPDTRSAPTREDFARYRQAMQRENCTFEKLETLPLNIGYLKLNSFPDPSVCEPTARATMARLNHVDAIIFDLRDNRGGEPDMVALMASYLFDYPEYWYNPRENTTQRSWTQSPVPGSRLADKPIYVLTSGRTLSGAEQFCYDLKMLKRATLVGETTGGAAHSGVWHRIDDHFGMGIPEARPINPYATPDWAETGVEPDVKAKAEDALQTAVRLAAKKLRKK